MCIILGSGDIAEQKTGKISAFMDLTSQWRDTVMIHVSNTLHALTAIQKILLSFANDLQCQIYLKIKFPHMERSSSGLSLNQTNKPNYHRLIIYLNHFLGSNFLRGNLTS